MPRPEPSADLKPVWEDDHLAVIVKPAGLPTANVPAGVASVHSLLRRRWGGGAFVGIVSRLDAPASGAVVVARTRAAAAHLTGQFRRRSVHKTYLAVVAGRFPGRVAEWQEWRDVLSRGPNDRRSLVAPEPAGRSTTEPAGEPVELQSAEGLDQAGRPARTLARVLRRAGEMSLVELVPETGRRHQLRAQLAARGCPIVGDRAYGSRLPHPDPAAIALHARRLEFTHPEDGRRIVVTAPWPASWQPRFARLLAGSS